MMEAKPEVPPSQMMNIAKVLLHLDSSHYLNSFYIHIRYELLKYWCTRVYAETIRKPAQKLEHPVNFFVYRTRHPNSIQEVWSRVTSTENVKDWKGKA